MTTVTNRRLCAALLAACGMAATAQADLLTDAQMYFDPASIQPDFYTPLELDDLASQHTITFEAGSNPLVGASILPILRPGDYVPGYSYSQADYFHTPNADYYADLTSGSLAASFMQPGLYHIRTYRADGQTDIFAVFAETHTGARSPAKTGVTKVLELPTADLFLVEDVAGETDDEDNAVIIEKHIAGTDSQMRRVGSRAAAEKAIEEVSVAKKRQIHVEIVGHGAAGYAAIGNGKNGEDPDKCVDFSSLLDFCANIDKYCDNLTFIACNVANGNLGQKFITDVAEEIHGNSGAWDCDVYSVDQSRKAVPNDGTYYAVPAGPSFFMFGTLVATRRRRT